MSTDHLMLWTQYNFTVVAIKGNRKRSHTQLADLVDGYPPTITIR